MTQSDLIVEMFKRGYTRGEIVRHVGCTPTYVRAVISRKITDPEGARKNEAEYRRRRYADPNFLERKRNYDREYRRQRRASLHVTS